MTAAADLQPPPARPDPGPDADPRVLCRAHWRTAAAVAGNGQMVLSWDGGRSYPARRGRVRPLSADPPDQPATVFVYDPDAGTGQTLVCDFDIGKARAAGAADPQAAVDADADAFAALIARAGGRCIEDASPSGGRHAYVLWERPHDWLQLKKLTQALARRFTTLDPSPMMKLTGLIRPPGSRYKLVGGRSPGWQVLLTPDSEIGEIIARRCGPPVWNNLHAELAAEHDAVSVHPAAAPSATQAAPADADGSPWLPRRARRPLRPDLNQIACTGRYPDRYATGSEARMAVLCSAAARGWHLHHVTAAMNNGTWPGLARLYHRYPPSSKPGAIKRDWDKAVSKAGTQKKPDETTAEKTTPNSHTKQCPSHPGGAGGPDRGARGDAANLSVDELIWTWRNAVWLAERDPSRRGVWGGSAISIRLILRALAAAMQMTRLPQAEFGCRDLAIHAKISYRTAADVLALLRSEDDPLIVRTQQGRGLRADRYRLRIPGAYKEDALWYRWRIGVVAPVHPAFRILGGTAFLVYDALGAEAAPAAEIARAAAVSPATVRKAAGVLGEHGMAVRDRYGWRRGPADLDRVAAAIGADVLDTEVRQEYARQRSEWAERLVRRDLPADDAAGSRGRDGSGRADAARIADDPLRTSPRAPPDGELVPAHLRLLEQVLGARVLAG